MVWLPYAQEGQPAKIESIGTHIGTIFWAHSSQEIEEALAPARKEIQDIEAKRPHSDVRSFFNCFLPLLLISCLQDAVRQVLREAVAIVKARGSMNYLPQRAKYLESVAGYARMDSLQRFGMTNLYRPLRRGERVRHADTLGESFAEILQQFFSDVEDLRKAIREILQEGGNPTPRAIARKLNIGKPHKQRDRDTGVKKVESMLKKVDPGRTAGQVLNVLAEEEKQKLKEKQIVKKNSRRKGK